MGKNSEYLLLKLTNKKMKWCSEKQSWTWTMRAKGGRVGEAIVFHRRSSWKVSEVPFVRETRAHRDNKPCGCRWFQISLKTPFVLNKTGRQLYLRSFSLVCWRYSISSNYECFLNRRKFFQRTQLIDSALYSVLDKPIAIYYRIGYSKFWQSILRTGNSTTKLYRVIHFTQTCEKFGKFEVEFRQREHFTSEYYIFYCFQVNWQINISTDTPTPELLIFLFFSLTRYFFFFKYIDRTFIDHLYLPWLAYTYCVFTKRELEFCRKISSRIIG